MISEEDSQIFNGDVPIIVPVNSTEGRECREIIGSTVGEVSSQILKAVEQFHFVE